MGKNLTYFNQADVRWASYPYPAKGYENATLKTSGCGPTTMAMIVSSMRQLIYPNEMAKLFLDNGQRLPGGTAATAPKWTGDRFGIKTSQSIYINDAVACLKRGGMVAAYMRAGGTFSTGGHIICLAEMKDDNTLLIYDPYLYAGKFKAYGRDKMGVTVSGNNVYMSVANFKKYNNYTLHLFEPVPEPTTKHKAGETITISSHYNSPDADVSQAMFDNPWKKGTIAYVQAGSRNPYLVDVGNAQVWVNDGDIREEKEIPQAKFPYRVEVTAKSGLNIRLRPKTNSSRLGVLPKGKIVSILEESNGWGRIAQGWISLAYTKRK